MNEWSPWYLIFCGEHKDNVSQFDVSSWRFATKCPTLTYLRWRIPLMLWWNVYADLSITFSVTLERSDKLKLPRLLHGRAKSTRVRVDVSWTLSCSPWVFLSVPCQTYQRPSCSQCSGAAASSSFSAQTSWQKRASVSWSVVSVCTSRIVSEPLLSLWFTAQSANWPAWRSLSSVRPPSPPSHGEEPDLNRGALASGSGWGWHCPSAHSLWAGDWSTAHHRTQTWLPWPCRGLNGSRARATEPIRATETGVPMLAAETGGRGPEGTSREGS